MNLQYYYLYVQRCFGYQDPESGLTTASYSSLRVNTAFNYQNMNQLLDSEDYDDIECQGYQAFLNPLVPGYITFLRMAEQADSQNSVTMGLSSVHKQSGWKFHILIADTQESDNLEQGWAIVKNELIHHQVFESKIIKDSMRGEMRADNEQSSKVITVYAFKENKTQEEWQQFIYDVSQALRSNNIAPAANPPGDIPIKNSEYFSYRNDGNVSDVPFANIDGSQNLRPTLTQCFK